MSVMADLMIGTNEQQRAPGQNGGHSRHFIGASVQHCRWLPCASSTADIGAGQEQQQVSVSAAALALWSEEAQSHALVIGNVVRSAGSNELLPFESNLMMLHRGSFTDLQTMRMGNTILALASSSTGAISALQAQLPDTATATSAVDLQLVPPDEQDGFLRPLMQLPQGAASSISINPASQELLVVGRSGGIIVGPVEQVEAAAASPFRVGSGWGGYSQGRWTGSHTFATVGLVGGLQLWDVRQGPKPISQSPASWGHTGHAALDKRHGTARQVLCMDVTPARPNLVATGSTGGIVALWDLRFGSRPLTWGPVPEAAGDVLQVHFDPAEPSSAAARQQDVPSLLYCTSDGALARTKPGKGVLADATNANGWASDAQLQGWAELLIKEASSVNAFDVQASLGQDILAATDQESLLFMHIPPPL